MAPRQVVGLILWIALCLGVGWLGGRVTAPALVDWYPSLAKPAWTPPDIAFPVVWTILYVMMGIAAWLVWRGIVARPVPAAGSAPSGRWLPLILFVAQLAINSLWSFLFFGLRSPALGLVDIVLLLALIGATILAFRRESPAAAALLVPYLLWVLYAAALNLAIWRMNPSA